MEGKHELGAETLAQRVLLDESLELGNELGLTAKREVGFDALLQRRDPQLLEPDDFARGERLVGEVGKRWAAPQAERPAQHRGRPLRIPGVEEIAPLLHRALKAFGIELIRGKPERVAASSGLEQAVAERLAQP